MDWSLIISILALCLSLITYFVHDIRIKKQERVINDYQLSQINEERQQKKQAAVKANIISKPGGTRIIKVFNSGKAVARNINFKILTQGNFHTLNSENLFPYELLNPQESTEFTLVIFKGSVNGNVDKIKVETTWEDDSSTQNKYEQLLTL
jgi:hypothetical protein